MIDLKKLTIKEAHDCLKNGDFSAEELSGAYLKNIEEKNSDLNAYLEVFDNVSEQAKKADEKIAKGEGSEMTGIPMAIKNNLLIKGERTTAGSKILDEYKAVYDATVIKKLKDSGAVFLGGTNLDEFAMGSSTENSAYGATKNPHDLERVPGGSSGGSAASVAADLSLAALGTDTGGSIRQPASLCGVVGLKTTYGAVSRYGAIAMGSSLDQIGPFAKTVEDAEFVFKVIKGEDKMDSTTIPDNLRKCFDIGDKLKIGVPRGLMEEGVDEDVLNNFNESLKKFEDAGYEIVDIELPNAKYALSVYYILMPAEVSTNLARFDGVRYGSFEEGDDLLADYMKTRGKYFGKETRRRVMLGSYVLSAGYYDAYYNKAIAVRKVITEEFRKVFESVDVIATPTSPTPAFKIGEKANDPLQMYLADIFTVPANIAGVPAISIPSGFTKRGEKNLPLGLQLTAPYMREDLLFKVGKDFEAIV